MSTILYRYIAVRRRRRIAIFEKKVNKSRRQPDVTNFGSRSVITVRSRARLTSNFHNRSPHTRLHKHDGAYSRF